jgi:hypothetical protein
VAIDDVRVAAGETTTHDVALRRDWAAASGGAEILRDPSKYDDTGAPFGCGLAQLIDQSLGSGWSPFNPDSSDPENPHIGPPTAVVELPQTIDVSAFGLDPSSTCGDDPTATTKDYRIETSSNGQDFAVAKQGTFTIDDRGRLNVVRPDANAEDVRFVRLTLLSPQSDGPGDSGRDFIDFSELEVFGGLPNRLPAGVLVASPGRVEPGQAVRFDASSFTDPDSKITGYEWDFDGNGTVDRRTAGAVTSFAYGAAGSFTARVAVSDFRGGAGSARAPVTVVAPAAVPPAATPPAAVVVPVVIPQPTLALPSRGSRGRLSFVVTCAQRCTVAGRLTFAAGQAGPLGFRRRTVRRFRRTLLEPGTHRITLRLPKRVRTAAARRDRRRVVVVLAVNATTESHQDKTARKKVRIAL